MYTEWKGNVVAGEELSVIHYRRLRENRKSEGGITSEDYYFSGQENECGQGFL